MYLKHSIQVNQIKIQIAHNNRVKQIINLMFEIAEIMQNKCNSDATETEMIQNHAH